MNTRTDIHILLTFAVMALALCVAWATNTTVRAQEAPVGGAQVSVAGNGQVIVRDATVTRREGASLTVTTSWGASAVTWIVHTSGTTRFAHGRVEGEDPLDAIHAGDTVTFSGQLDGSRKALTVYAGYIKNTSLLQESVLRSGTVIALDDDSFTLATDETEVRVLSGTGTFVIENGESVGFASIRIGDSVRASGTLNTATNELRAGRIDIIERAVSAEESPGLLESVMRFLRTGGRVLSIAHISP